MLAVVEIIRRSRCRTKFIKEMKYVVVEPVVSFSSVD